MTGHFRNFYLLAFLSIVLRVPADARNNLFSCTESIDTEQKKYQYLLYLPADYLKSTKKYPVVFYLHGSSQKGNDLNKLKAYGPPHAVEKGKTFDFIIVSPQCPENVALWSSESWFETLYSEISSKFRIDEKRVYLTGVSMGGGGAFELAKQHPDIFAAVVPLCAWQSSEKDLCRLKNVPVWTLHGVDDHVVPIEETDEKAKVLTECKGNIKYTRLKGEGHGIHWLYDQTDNYNIYEWMLSHSKK